jgi:outer membrane protein
MPWRILAVLLGWVGALCSSGLAKDNDSTGLFVIYQLALEHAPELQVAREQLLADQQILAQTRSELLPSLTISAEYGRVERRADAIAGVLPDSDNHYPRQAYQATLSQSLLNLEEWHTYQAGKVKARSAEARFREALQDFRLQVVKAYFETLRAQSQLRTREAELNAIRRQKKQIEQQMDAGLASLLEVQEIRAEAQRVNVSLIRAQGRVDQRLQALEALAGTQLLRISPLVSSLKVTGHKTRKVSDWLKLARTTNPQLIKTRLNRSAARDQVSAARSARLPRLSLNLNYRFDGASAPNSGMPGGEGLETNTASVALQLQMPLFSGGRLSANRKKAWHRYGQSREQYRQVRQDVFNKIRTQVQTIQTQQEAIAAAEQSLVAQKMAVKAAQKGYEAGLRDLVDVVRARRERFTAVEVLNDARVDLILALARLHRLGGSLDEARLKQFSRWVATR